MREPVADWFRAQGYECAYERFFASGYCDILAFRFAPQTAHRIPDLLEAVAVELKLTDVGRALYQARGYWLGGARSYVAMPLDRCKRMRQATRDRFYDQHIGLLSVRQEANILGYQIEVWEAAETRDVERIQWMKKKLWRVHKDYEKERNAEAIRA